MKKMLGIGFLKMFAVASLFVLTFAFNSLKADTVVYFWYDAIEDVTYKIVEVDGEVIGRTIVKWEDDEL